ncbi:uncharacterized protein EDB93DRAFT_114071 [Suillus bovinus]|uniref:uncharacterized protein n=1 Tax=Suillus bovinus TaxID=48563 RepID=UPI001B87D680|nr:uncharacterized protein EDB93DRAFT_114071 [Suillus bovinus]KAG2129660.1 hypothetical protein EDB93DRAFT_114071 [Suillus bovinus]
MPPSQCVKDYIKDLGKVFAVRLRRPKKDGPRQRSSTTADHEGAGFIHAQVPTVSHFSSPIPSSNSSLVHSTSSREPGLESNVPFARYSGSVSFTRQASDMAQLALPLVQNIASAIPLVGAPMQAAISGLLTGLQAIDRHSQNEADLNSLISRLGRLSRELCNASPASDPVEQSRRDFFVRYPHHRRMLGFT